MSPIRTFYMQNVIYDGHVLPSGAEEIVEPTDFGELTPEGYIVFADIEDDRLHSITIHNGVAGGGLLISHYGKTARLVGHKVPVAIGTPLVDILTMPELKNTVYEPFFQEVSQLLQKTTEENREAYGTSEGVTMRITVFLEEQKEPENEEPQPDPVS